jgi:hypothetical protein
MGSAQVIALSEVRARSQWQRLRAALHEALRQVKEAGLIPEESVRLCVICDGAEWIWKHVQHLFPNACQVLDYYHCSEYLHKVAKAQYGNSEQAQEWAEATLTRLYLGKVGQVLGGLRRMQPTSDDAPKARCAKYNGTFHQVFARSQHQKSEV